MILLNAKFHWLGAILMEILETPHFKICFSYPLITTHNIQEIFVLI